MYSMREPHGSVPILPLTGRVAGALAPAAASAGAGARASASASQAASAFLSRFQQAPEQPRRAEKRKRSLALDERQASIADYY